MAPFTATSWTTALRRAVSSAKQAVVHSVKPRLTQRAIQIARNKAIHTARQALHETFPSLSSHTYALRQAPRFALQPIPLNPLQRASMNVRTQAFRSPRSPRGAGMVSQVGLGSARSYSSIHQHATANVHILLRPLAGIDKSFCKPTWYDSYPPRRARGSSARRQRRIPRIECVDIAPHAKPISEVDHYFPFASSSSAPAAVAEQVVPEQLVTPGVTSTLSIALRSSIDGYSDSLEAVTYRDAEVGVTVFSNLLSGIPNVSEAHTWHGTRRIFPLVAKLESYGLFRDRGEMTPQMWEDRGQDGLPDVLHIVFPSRSASDVRRILGETLEGGEWFVLVESLPYSMSETEQMTEVWETSRQSTTDQRDQEPPRCLASSFETQSSSASSGEASYHGTLDDLPLVDSSIYASSTLTPAASRAFLDQMEQSEVESLVFPCLDISESSAAEFDALPVDSSFAWSSGSSDVDSFGSEGASVAWSVPPSEADDLDSVMSDMDWSEAGTPASPHGSRPSSPEMSWAGGSGYGILQPW